MIEPIETKLRSPRGRRFLLVAAALGLFACASFFLLLVPLTAGRLERPSGELIPTLLVWRTIASLAPLLPASPSIVVAAVLIVGTLAFALYGLAVWLTWRRSGWNTTRLVVIVGIVLLTLPIVALPNHQTDVWDYIAFGRVTAAHGASPYDVAPSAFPEDPLLRYASPEYRNLVDNKLPAWTLASTALAAVAGDDPIRALLTYRVAFWAMNIATLVLLVWITRRLDPRRAATAALIWSWNPIAVVWGHKTDAFMVLLLVLAAFAVVHRRRLEGFVAVALSGLVKLITLSVAIVEIAGALRRRGPAVALAMAALGIAIAALVYLPFYRGPATLIAHVQLLSRGASVLPDVVRPVAILAYVAFLGWLGWTRRDATTTPFEAWAIALLAFGIFFTVPDFPWYLMSLIATIALARSGWLFAASLPVWLASFLLNARETVLTAAFSTDVLFVPPRGTLYAGLAAVLILLAVARRRRVGPWRAVSANASRV